MTNSNLITQNSSQPHLILIIGNRFTSFAERHRWAITFSKFEKVWEPQKIKASNIIFLPGQGLHDDQRYRIAKWAISAKNEIITVPERAARWMAHKHEAKNILVSGFYRTEPTHFEGHLLVDDRNELLSDHVHEHLSGMLEMETVRQAFLVVTEQFYLPRGDSPYKNFITLQKSIEFKQFFFPLPALIRFHMIKADLSRLNRMQFKAQIELVQAGQICGKASVEYLVLQKENVTKKEYCQAENAMSLLSKNLNFKP